MMAAGAGMLLRQLVTHFLQTQAKAQFADVLRGAPKPATDGPAPHPTPLLVDGLLFYPSDLEGGGALDRLQEKCTTQCEGFLEQTGRLGEHRVAMVEVGDGARAGEIAAAALAVIRPLWVISFGFASGLAPTLRRGDILMASHVVDEAGKRRAVGLRLAAGEAPQPGLHFGDLLTVARTPDSAEQRKALAAGGALAWDADSAFIAEAAASEASLISVRMISEGINDKLPRPLRVIREQKSIAAKLGAAAGALLDRPGSVAEMWRLRESAIDLSDRLAKFLLGVVAQLPQRDEKPGPETT
jgi:adenosylhomocysteine nucleosidase